jgi:POT family proton-dependent oligopeptide transporter
VPTITGFYAKTAPPALTGAMIGVYNLSVFAGSIISGRMGSLYETLTPGAFWSLHAGLVALGGLIFLGIGWRFGNAFAPGAPKVS